MTFFPDTFSAVITSLAGPQIVRYEEEPVTRLNIPILSAKGHMTPYGRITWC